MAYTVTDRTVPGPSEVLASPRAGLELRLKLLPTAKRLAGPATGGLLKKAGFIDKDVVV